MARLHRGPHVSGDAIKTRQTEVVNGAKHTESDTPLLPYAYTYTHDHAYTYANARVLYSPLYPKVIDPN